jgi:hypothetical protein
MCWRRAARDGFFIAAVILFVLSGFSVVLADDKGDEQHQDPPVNGQVKFPTGGQVKFPTWLGGVQVVGPPPRVRMR